MFTGPAGVGPLASVAVAPLASTVRVAGGVTPLIAPGAATATVIVTLTVPAPLR